MIGWWRWPNLVGRGSRKTAQLNRSSRLSWPNYADIPKARRAGSSAGSRLGAFRGVTHYSFGVRRFPLAKHTVFREPRPTKLGLPHKSPVTKHQSQSSPSPSPEQIHLRRPISLAALPILRLFFQALTFSLQLCRLDSQVILLLIKILCDAA